MRLHIGIIKYLLKENNKIGLMFNIRICKEKFKIFLTAHTLLNFSDILQLIPGSKFDQSYGYCCSGGRCGPWVSLS